MMDAIVISGTRRAMKELVDGTIRVQIDVDPAHRNLFLQHMSQIDMPVALAPLVLNPVPKPKNEPTISLGPLCLLAVQLCQDPKFWKWAQISNMTHPDSCEQQAKSHILKACDITSRKELDTSEDAAIKFHERIRKPYNAWLKENT